MATKQIKDYGAVSAPAAADLLITQQAADNVTKKITITQIIATVKAIASGLASLNSSVKVVEQPASITDHLDNTAEGTDSEVTKAPTSNVMYDHGVKTTAVHGVGGSNVCSESTADSKIATHAGLADPHTGYRLESADHTHESTGAQAGKLNVAALNSYDSGWFVVAANNTYAKTHSLGALPKFASVWFSANSNGNDAKLVQAIGLGAGSDWSGMSLTLVTTTSCTLITGTTNCVSWNSSNSTSGYARIVLAI